MELLRSREAVKGQQNKVASIILQKVLSKHGTGKRASEVNNAIKSKVEEFTANRPKLDARELAQLDREVAEMVRMLVREISLRSSSSAPKNFSPRGGGDEARTQGELIRAKSREALDAMGDWSVINALRVVEAKEEEERRIAAKEEKKVAVLAQLERQKKELDDKKALARQEKEIWRQKQQAMVAEWKEEELKVVEREKAKHAEERMIRNKQIAENKNKIEQEKAARKEHETAEIAMVRRELERQEENRLASIKRERERNDALMLENQKERVVREAQRKRDWDEDQRMMKEYKAKLDHEEEARTQYYESRKQASEKHGAKFASEGAGKEQADAAARIEAIVRAEQEKKAAADKRREDSDLNKIAESKRMIKRDNEALVASKKAIADKDAAEREMFHQMYAQEAANAIAAEAKKVADRRENATANQVVLVEQITRVKKAKSLAKAEMSERERLLNKNLFESAKKKKGELQKLLPPGKIPKALRPGSRE